jgi:hypothetical protein
MSYTKKTFEELDVMDDFLMNAVAADPEVGENFCRTVLSVLLNRSIGKLRIVAQRTIPALTPEHRGIRMDVEIEESLETEEFVEIGQPVEKEKTVETKAGFPPMNIYDLEPHKQKGTSLPRRNRFYQAKIDGRYLESGAKDFAGLPNLYVITLLNYDPFGYDYMLYTIHNKCEEVAGLIYEDGWRHRIEKYAAISSGQSGGERGGCRHPATPRMCEQGEDAAGDEVGVYEI